MRFITRLKSACIALVFALAAPSVAHAQGASAFPGVRSNDAPPNIASCGGGSITIAPGSNSTFGSVTVGTGSPTACTLNWTTWQNFPGQPLTQAFTAKANTTICVATAAAAGSVVTYSGATTLSITFNFSLTPTSFTYYCPGY